jgi:DNA-binding winged helix-turn-helix (wHTH) protein
MVGRILVVGLSDTASRAAAAALRGGGAAVLEAASPADVDGLGFAAVVGRGCGAWYTSLRAAARLGLRIAFADDPGTARHADLVVPGDTAPEQLAALILARVPGVATGRWAIGDRVVDLDRRRVGDTELGPQESALLALLLAVDGEVVSTERLLRDAWGASAAVATRAVDHAAHRLRQLLEDTPGRPDHLLTVRGEGLRLVGVRRLGTALPEPVEVATDPPAEGLAAVGDFLERALAIHPNVALVGPVGAGKSLLLRAWARERGLTAVAVDVWEGEGGVRVVAARRPVAGFVTVALPDRTADLSAIAAHTARAAGQEPLADDVIAAVVARIGPNALGVVRFVERARWIPPTELLARLDAGQLGVLSSPSARDPRHRSLAAALAEEVRDLPVGAEDALAALTADPGAPVPPALALALVDAGLAARTERGLHPWPALAAFARAERGA